jgi:hypothetical protein
MNIYKNETLIKRNTTIARIGLVVTFAALIGGMYVSIKIPNQVNLSFGLLVVALLLFQVTIYFQNRWGRRPRPDQVLDTALKGLDNRYSLYHYLSPVNHLLIGPSGIWSMIPINAHGRISYAGGRWRQKGGNLYWKIFGQESLGRPDYEVENDKAKIAKFLQQFDEEEFPPAEAALVFTDPRTVIDIPDGTEMQAATVKVNDLKEAIRKAAKAKSLSMVKIKLLEDALHQE